MVDMKYKLLNSRKDIIIEFPVIFRMCFTKVISLYELLNL